MHLIPIKDQLFGFSEEPTKVDIRCNGSYIGMIERHLSPDADTAPWRFNLGGVFYSGLHTYAQALDSLKRTHVAWTLTAKAVEAIGEYVAAESAKLFGDEP